MTADYSSAGATPSGAASRIERLEQFAYWSDECIPIPGIDTRIGLDPIIGLVPVWGDVITGVLSCYVPYQAYQVGAPPSLVFKMLVLVVLDACSGAIPVAGDLIDAAFKANKINVRMLKRHLEKK